MDVVVADAVGALWREDWVRVGRGHPRSNLCLIPECTHRRDCVKMQQKKEPRRLKRHTACLFVSRTSAQLPKVRAGTYNPKPAAAVDSRPEIRDAGPPSINLVMDQKLLELTHGHLGDNIRTNTSQTAGQNPTSRPLLDVWERRRNVGRAMSQ